MGRRKKGFLRLPFLTINKHTVFNIFGFALIAVGIITGLSFLRLFSNSQQGVVLDRINRELVGRFGGFSLFVPFLIIFTAGHFFNTKKFKFIKLNLTIGTALIFVSLLGFFRAGAWGRLVYESLVSDFSFIGAVIILSFTFIIGLILFLDTSVDVFALFIWNMIKPAFVGNKKNGGKDRERPDEKGEKERFIFDEGKKDRKPLGPTTPVPIAATASSTPVPKNFEFKSITASKMTTWIYPPLNLLQEVTQKEAIRGDVNDNADKIEKTLDSFGIRARVKEVNKGPTVTQYALAITMGTKLSKITALGNDLALALAAPTGQVRIEAPIPGRSLVGVEIPNLKSEIVTEKKLLSSPIFTQNPDPLLVPLGLDVSGEPQATSIQKMPHVLIAGTTGSGKSVLLNSWISTFLFRTKPDEVRLILVDPKRVELTLYNGIPHLLTDVIVEPEKIISALRWVVAEMENRYKEFAKAGARNLEGFNELEGVEKKPYIIFIIDELADLMIFAPGDAEELITRIAQMARATGIHLILATQRPSVDVITGLMKANIPTRIAFNVSSMIDSRVIIDMPGAEKLLGKGDMLFLPPDQAKPRRIQGPYITEREVNDLVKFLKSQVPEVHYTEEITQHTGVPGVLPGGLQAAGGQSDPYFNQAIDIISQFDKASASLLQRRLKVGYARAARLLDELEAAGYVSPAEGSKPREVIKRLSSEGSA